MVANLSLSNTIKIELIAERLQALSHEVEVISPGEVVGTHVRLYRGFREAKPFHEDIPVHYASTLPVRFVNGFWSSWRLFQLFAARHLESPFDVVIVFNPKRPHITCAIDAIRQFGLPVVLEYEDDLLVNVMGQQNNSAPARYQRQLFTRLLNVVSGGIAVSPRLLAQFPERIPKLLLRGVVGDDIARRSALTTVPKRNWILFSGTLVEWSGIAKLVESWDADAFPGWELHITGHGQLTEQVKQAAAAKRGVIFHGLVNRETLVDLLCSSRICVNPYAVSQSPGNVFAFKIIEYLAAGAHCITTPMGALEPEIEAGITYMPDNMPATIAATLQQVINERRYERPAADAVLRRYGAASVEESLDSLLQAVMESKACSVGV